MPKVKNQFYILPTLQEDLKSYNGKIVFNKTTDKDIKALANIFDVNQNGYLDSKEIQSLFNNIKNYAKRDNNLILDAKKARLFLDKECNQKDISTHKLYSFLISVINTVKNKNGKVNYEKHFKNSPFSYENLYKKYPKDKYCLKMNGNSMLVTDKKTNALVANIMWNKFRFQIFSNPSKYGMLKTSIVDKNGKNMVTIAKKYNSNGSYTVTTKNRDNNIIVSNFSKDNKLTSRKTTSKQGKLLQESSVINNQQIDINYDDYQSIRSKIVSDKNSSKVYNRENILVDETIYNNNGSTINKKYDKNGKLLFTTWNSKKSKNNYTSITKNAAGKIVRRVYCKNGEDIITEYDENGQIKSQTKGNTSIDISNGKVYKKNDENFIVNEIDDCFDVPTFKGYCLPIFNLGKPIQKIDAGNVMTILNDYEVKHDPSNLLQDISENGAILSCLKNKYINHIYNALKQVAKTKNIDISDIENKYNKALKYDRANRNFSTYIARIAMEIEGRISAKSELNINYRVKNVKANGKVDNDFSQGMIGDCWLLASIKVLANNKKGKQILDNSLKVDKSGNIFVTLQGVNKTYKITPKEIELNFNFVEGDMDVRAIEIAVNKYMSEQKANIRGNTMSYAYKLLIPQNNIQNIQCFNIESNKWFSDKMINSFNQQNKIICVSSHKSKKNVQQIQGINGEHLSTNHAYTVLKSDDKYVYLVNPHNTSKELVIDRKSFKRFFNDLQQMTIK